MSIFTSGRGFGFIKKKIKLVPISNKRAQGKKWL
jgi:hypothetical protein